MAWFTNRGQIVQTAVAIIALALGAVALLNMVMNLQRQGASFDSISDLMMSLSFFGLIVILLAIWAWRATSQERDLEQQAKTITSWKTLCDVQAQIPAIPDDPVAERRRQQRAEMLAKRLREAMEESIPVVMGWTRRAKPDGFAVGYVVVLAIFAIPATRQVFIDLMQVGPKAAAQVAEAARAAHYTPNALDRWGILFATAVTSAFGPGLLLMIGYIVGTAVAKRILQKLRETNGAIPPLIPYVVQSLVSGAQSLLSEIRRSS